MIDGTVRGVLNFPRVDIYVSGKCRFAGSIDAGNINIEGTLVLG